MQTIRMLDDSDFRGPPPTASASGSTTAAAVVVVAATKRKVALISIWLQLSGQIHLHHLGKLVGVWKADQLAS